MRSSRVFRPWRAGSTTLTGACFVRVETTRLCRFASTRSMPQTRAHPGQPVFFAPYSFMSENIAVQTIPGPGPTRFVGLIDRYTPQLATKTIPIGMLASLLFSCVLAILVTWVIAQRVRRGLQRAE